MSPRASFKCYYCCHCCNGGITKGLEFDNHFISRWPVVFNDWSICKISHPCRQLWKLLPIHNFQPNNLFQYGDQVTKPTKSRSTNPMVSPPKNFFSFYSFSKNLKFSMAGTIAFSYSFPFLKFN